MLNIDWWSLIRETRAQAWESMTSVLGSLLNEFWKILTSGHPVQTILVIALFTTLVYTSSKAILKLILRLTRNDAFNF